jgi:glycerol-3-phosphate acyltransferase PlsY
LIDFIFLIAAYLIGSIPSSVWIGKRFYGVDVREYGSGNAGATNTFRVLGKKAGIPVLILDTLKGWLAVNIACLSHYQPASEQFINLQLVLGIAALIGHIFPIYVGFRGGKGIATLLGILLAVHPQAAVFSMIIFLLVLIVFNYVSLGSIIAAIVFPLMIIFFFKETVPSLIIFSIAVSILVLVTHQKNMARLMRKEESKTYIFRRKNDK